MITVNENMGRIIKEGEKVAKKQTTWTEFCEEVKLPPDSSVTKSLEG
jgi:hypothetical protein